VNPLLRLFASLCVLGLLVPVVAAADTEDGRYAPLKARMQKYVDEAQLSGAVTVVGTSKGVLNTTVVGQADLDSKKAMQADTVFRIASMTKPITAMGIMVLIDQKKLSVEDPVEKYLPEFKGQMLVESKMNDKITLKKPSRPITIRDLLTHTSGLPFYSLGYKDVYAERNRTLAEAVMLVSQQPLDFEPGTKWAYCNSGIDVLGRIIEVVSGKSYEDFLADRFFEPLGMKDTTFVVKDNERGRVATLYAITDKKLTPAPLSLLGWGKAGKHPVPAGGLYSTGGDLAKLYQLMLNKGKVGEKQWLSEESVKVMTQIHTGDLKAGFTPGTGYGFGWAVVKTPEGVSEMLSEGTYGHGGAFGTQAWIDPKKDAYFILLIQRSDLKNSDASEIRLNFQRLAVDAMKK